MYDTIIIGAGPAGMTAAVYSARQKMKTLVLTENIGGQTLLSQDIRNYLGYTFISGAELADKFKKHVKEYSVDLKENEPASDIERVRGGFLVKTETDTYMGKTIIICSGKKPRLLNAHGEKRFTGKGVTYCAICDGPLFGGKDVAIIGGGNSALTAALQMLNIARKTYIVNMGSELGGEAIVREKIKKTENIEIINNANIKRINGSKFVSSISVRVNNGMRKIDVQGVIVEVGYIPNVEFADIVTKNRDNEIIINCKTETNIPGVFAAGDVTDVCGKQIIIAAGEGSKASIAAFQYASRT
ncbi:MAG: FAD-dependent oxidoreductase [Candidatus Micrarchaeota archaeon]